MQTRSSIAIASDIAGKLAYNDGMYVSHGISVKVSYPDDGHATCFLDEDESYWFRHRNECIRTVIQRFGISGVVLDVGGGNGFVAKMLSGIGLDPILVEPSMQGCVNARQRGVRNIICSSLKDLDFSKSKADVAGIFDVLEHIEDEDLFLKEISRALPENGKLLISVPAYPWLWSSDDKYAGHYRRYSAKYIKDILGRNGFKVLYCSYFFNFLVVPIFLCRRIKFLLNNAMGKDCYKYEKRAYVVTNKLLQYFLTAFSRAECDLLRRRSVPAGTSILVVAEKRCGRAA